MPIYEYKCSKCDHQFEQLVKSMSGEADVACPECGSGNAEKQFSVFAARQAQPAAPAVPPGCGACAQAGSCPMRE